MTQDFILAQLLSQNVVWAWTTEEADPGFFARTSKEPQEPKVLWIGCADSRVPESVVTASEPGQIFVHRNIANQFRPDDDNALAVITHAVVTLLVDHVVVVGHTNCGGVRACANAVGAAPSADPPTALDRWLAPLVEIAKEHYTGNPDDLTALIEENVRAQVDNVARCDVVRDAWAPGRDVQVHGWVYEIETGRLRDLGVTVGRDGRQ